MTKWLSLALTFCAVFLAACSDSGDGGSPTTAPAGRTPEATLPVEVERSDGEVLRLDKPPSRVVSLSPAVTEIIYAIGAEDALAAVDRYSDYPAEAAAFEPRLDAFEPNVEAIAGLDPDLVIVESDVDGLVGALDRLGIPTLYISISTDITTLDQVVEQVRLYGHVFGRESDTEALAASMEERIAAVTGALEDVEEGGGPRVFHELDATLYSAAPDSFVGDFYRLLKAQNIAEGADTPYPQLSNEVIVERDPEVIILADEGFGESPDTVKARAGWQNVSAVVNGRIYGIDPNIVSRPGPRVAEALEQLAKLLYPDQFGS